MTDGAAIRDTIVALLQQRDVSASICPSEVARALHADEAVWRAAMPDVRGVARTLAQEGIVRVTQREKDVPAEEVGDVTGPIRLRRGPAFPRR